MKKTTTSSLFLQKKRLLSCTLVLFFLAAACGSPEQTTNKQVDDIEPQDTGYQDTQTPTDTENTDTNPNDTDTNSNDTDTNTDTENTDQPQEGQISLTVQNASESNPYNDLLAASGTRFVILDIQLKNGANSTPLSPQYDLFSLTLESNTIIAASPKSATIPRACSPQIQIPADNQHACELLFEVPFGQIPKTLHYTATSDERKASAPVNSVPCTPCGNHCVDLKTNPDHCGACNTALSNGQTCNDGQPTCLDPDLTNCNGECVDLNTDIDHCGQCNDTCDGLCETATCILPGYTHVETDSDVSCALVNDQTIRCWGNNSDGIVSKVPTGQFTRLSLNTSHACALRTDGIVKCWGNNISNQTNSPANIQFSSVFAGHYHSCGIQPDGTVECWGANRDGQSTNIPTLPTGTSFTSLIGNSRSTCGILNDQTVRCWGATVTYAGLSTTTQYTQVTAGWDTYCGLKTNGTVECWGNTTTLPPTPNETFAALSTTSNSRPAACALKKSDNTTLCWGDLTSIFKDDLPPTQPLDQISLGFEHTCFIHHTTKQLTCFGSNQHQQLNVPTL